MEDALKAVLAKRNLPAVLVEYLKATEGKLESMMSTLGHAMRLWVLAHTGCWPRTALWMEDLAAASATFLSGMAAHETCDRQSVAS